MDESICYCGNKISKERQDHGIIECPLCDKYSMEYDPIRKIIIQIEENSNDVGEHYITIDKDKLKNILNKHYKKLDKKQ